MAASKSSASFRASDKTQDNDEYEGEFPSTNGNSDMAGGNSTEKMEFEEGKLKKKKKPKKRSAPTGEPQLPKRFKLNPGDFHKNPLMALNEYKPGLKYSVDSVEGPSHNPKYTVSVEADGKGYIGTGRSKQDAKQSAARAILSTFFPNFPNPSPVDQTNFGGSNDSAFDAEAGTLTQKRLFKVLRSGENKNPIMLLNELHPNLEYNLMAENSVTPSMRFSMSVTVNNRPFEGSGHSKKEAKAAAARAVLASMYGHTMPVTSEIPGDEGENMEHLEPLSQSLADKIAEATFAKYSEVMIGQKGVHQRWKVMASICMTDDEAMEHVVVVSLGTGTKCINAEHVSMNGATLNDCHAEILANRSFKDFIYNQLELHVNHQSSKSILQPLPSGGFRVKKNIAFHLFVTAAPCGDARIFLSKEPNMPDKHPNRKVRGLLRSKIESEEGSVPVKPYEAAQSCEAIQGGQRLLTMSCSDKITKWNVLGIQGALLGQFVEPIYLHSVVLGSLFNPSHMYKALGGRIKNSLPCLPQPYDLCVPKMCTANSKIQPTHASKSQNHCMNWGIDQQVEVIDASTGKVHSNQVSRLVRRQFLARFCTLRNNVRMLPIQLEKNATMYVKAKSQAKDYQQAKQKMLDAFRNSGLGLWVRKPEELGQFEYGF